jgi:116 kDa U5 small nuclear ribonucleoprotein component
MVQITKLYHTTDAQSFRAFGRVLSGTLKKGMQIKVLGEGFSQEDDEQMRKAIVEDLWISEARLVFPNQPLLPFNYSKDISFLPQKSWPEILSSSVVSMRP